KFRSEPPPVVERCLKSRSDATCVSRIDKVVRDHDEPAVAGTVGECRKLHTVSSRRRSSAMFWVEMLFKPLPAIGVIVALQNRELRGKFGELLGIACLEHESEGIFEFLRFELAGTCHVKSCLVWPMRQHAIVKRHP